MNREPFKLLVVDGEEQVRRLLHRLLTRAGYEVYLARTAEEAISLWAPSINFDAIVCETVLPGMDGHAFARHMALRDSGSPMIFVCTIGEQCEACPHARKCRFIGKPFHPSDVLQTIAEAIHERSGTTD